MDWNDDREGPMGLYVEYLFATDRWVESREDAERADLGNSHSPMLPTYSGMLERYKRIRTPERGAYDRLELTVDELLQIVPAWARPTPSSSE